MLEINYETTRLYKWIIGTATAYRSSLQYLHLTWWHSEGCPLREAHPKVVAWPLSWTASHAGLRSCLSLLLQPTREIINFKLDSHYGKSCAQVEKGRYYELALFQLFIECCLWSVTILEMQEPCCAMIIYKKLLVEVDIYVCSSGLIQCLIQFAEHLTTQRQLQRSTAHLHWQPLVTRMFSTFSPLPH